MSEAAPRRFHWLTWIIVALGLLAVPANIFMVQFWRWANSHHAPEAGAQDGWAILVIVLALAAAGLALVAAFRRWRGLAIGLSLAQILPPLAVCGIIAAGA